MLLPRVSLLLTVPVALVVACRSSAAPEAENPLTLQVLVEMRLDGTPADSDRGPALSAAGDRLLRALQGAGIAHEVVRRYDTIPWIALRISPADRDRVAALPEVAAVRDDRAEKTLSKGGS